MWGGPASQGGPWSGDPSARLIALSREHEESSSDELDLSPGDRDRTDLTLSAPESDGDWLRDSWVFNPEFEADLSGRVGDPAEMDHPAERSSSKEEEWL